MPEQSPYPPGTKLDATGKVIYVPGTRLDAEGNVIPASALPAGTLPMGSKSPFGQPPGGATGVEIPTGTKTPFPGALEKPKGPSLLPMRTEPLPPPPPSARDLRTYGNGVTPEMAKANVAHLPMMGGIVGGLMMGGPLGAVAGGIRGAAMGGAAGEASREVIEGEEIDPLKIGWEGVKQAAPTAIARGAARLGKYYTPTVVNESVNVPSRTSAILNASGKPIEHGLDEFGRPITRTITSSHTKAVTPTLQPNVGVDLTGRPRGFLGIGTQYASPKAGRIGQGLQNASPSIDALTRQFILSLMGQGPGGTPEGR
jgi:hypothetical protein